MSKLQVKDWKQDTVYLVQFPRARCVPSISSYCLKLETWLRMAGLQYENVSNQFKIMSERGQLPFVEINGRQISDSTNIFNALSKCFCLQIDKNLNDNDSGNLVVYTSLIQDSLGWVVAYFRSLDNSIVGTEQGLIGHFDGIEKVLVRKFVVKKMESNVSENICRY